VEFTVDAFPYRTFHGKVMQVRNAPVTVQNVVTYDTVVEVNNADLKLKPGMTANVSIVIARRENAVKLPNAALRFRPPETATAQTKTNSTTAGTSNQTTSSVGGSRRSGESGGVRGGPAGSGGPGNRPRGERSSARTIYTLTTDGTLKPLTVKLGISDGIVTEVVEGLNEGDVVVTGLVQAKEGVAAPTSNPFGGGFPRR
jgi:HlyD family secretion protein